MTELEFITRELMGPPASGKSWHCPFHVDEHPSFGLLPHKPEFKDRYKCWGCGEYGDELDLLKYFFPEDDFEQRLQRRKRYHARYRRLEATDPPLSLRGRGARPHNIEPPADDPDDVASAWADVYGWLDKQDISYSEEEAVQLLEEVVRKCEMERINVKSLVQYWRDFITWKNEHKASHAKSIQTKRRRA